MFRVCEKRCDECLFSNAKIVSDERKADVLDQCVRTDTHFVCHKHTIRELLREGVGDGNVCCRGFYDHDPAATSAMRIAGRLGIVVFVDEKGYPSK